MFINKAKLFSLSSLVILSVLAFVTTNFIVMGQRLPWLDEDFTLFLISQSWSDFWYIVTIREMNMSLYYVSLKIWSLLSMDHFYLRALSVIYALLAALFVYKFTTTISTKNTAKVAVIICLLNVIFFRYAHELRGYSLFALTTLISIYYCFQALKENTHNSWILFTLSCVFLFYSHMLAAIIVTAQFLLLLWVLSKRDYLKIAISALVIWICIFPLFYQLIQLGGSPVSWAQTISIRSGFKLATDLVVSPFLTSNLIRLVFITLVAVLFVFAIKAANSDDERRNQLLTLIVLSALIFAGLASFMPIMSSRFALNLVPMLVVFTAIGFMAINNLVVRATVAVGFLAVFTVSAVSLFNKQGDDWEQLERIVTKNCLSNEQEKSLIAYYKPSALVSLSRVKGVIEKRCPTISFVTSFEPKELYREDSPYLPNDISITPSDYQQIWLIEYYVPGGTNERFNELEEQVAEQFSYRQEFQINSNANMVKLHRFFN